MHGLKSHWVTPQRHQCLCASFHQWPAAEVWRQVKTRPWLFQIRICRKSFVSSCFLLVGLLHPQQLLCWTLQLQHHTTMPGCPAVWALMPILPRLHQGKGLPQRWWAWDRQPTWAGARSWTAGAQGVFVQHFQTYSLIFECCYVEPRDWTQWSL